MDITDTHHHHRGISSMFPNDTGDVSSFQYMGSDVDHQQHDLSIQRRLDNSHQSLEKQRRQLEEEMETSRLHTSEDPLSAFYNYIVFVGDKYPECDHMKLLLPVTTRCLKKLFYCDRYYQDDRLLHIVLNDTRLHPDDPSRATNMFKIMYRRGIATKSSRMYVEWATALERNSQVDKAHRSIVLGMKERAEPEDELLKFYRDFIYRHPQYGNSKNRNEATKGSGEKDEPVGMKGGGEEDESVGMKGSGEEEESVGMKGSGEEEESVGMKGSGEEGECVGMCENMKTDGIVNSQTGQEKIKVMSTNDSSCRERCDMPPPHRLQPSSPPPSSNVGNMEWPKHRVLTKEEAERMFSVDRGGEKTPMSKMVSQAVGRFFRDDTYREKVIEAEEILARRCENGKSASERGGGLKVITDNKPLIHQIEKERQRVDETETVECTVALLGLRGVTREKKRQLDDITKQTVKPLIPIYQDPDSELEDCDDVIKSRQGLIPVYEDPESECDDGGIEVKQPGFIPVYEDTKSILEEDGNKMETNMIPQPVIPTYEDPPSVLNSLVSANVDTEYRGRKERNKEQRRAGLKVREDIHFSTITMLVESDTDMSTRTRLARSSKSVTISDDPPSVRDVYSLHEHANVRVKLLEERKRILLEEEDKYDDVFCDKENEEEAVLDIPYLHFNPIAASTGKYSPSLMNTRRNLDTRELPLVMERLNIGSNVMKRDGFACPKSYLDKMSYQTSNYCKRGAISESAINSISPLPNSSSLQPLASSTTKITSERRTPRVIVTDETLRLIKLSACKCFPASPNMMPQLRVNGTTSISDSSYKVIIKLGEGRFGKVYLIEGDKEHPLLACKVVGNGMRPYEVYVRDAISERGKSNINVGLFCDYKSAHVFSTGYILIMPFHPHGTLLDLINNLASNHVNVHEKLLSLWTSHLLSAIHFLHSIHIIHMDIKADNIVMTYRNNQPDIALIDFGSAIDLQLTNRYYEEKKSLSSSLNLQPLAKRYHFNFSLDCREECLPMREGREWLYEEDYCGIAVALHVPMFGSYANLCETPQGFSITHSMKRIWQGRDMWKELFYHLLNKDLVNLDCYSTEFLSLHNSIYFKDNVKLNYKQVLKAMNYEQ